MQMNPREATEKIRKDYERYLQSLLLVQDEEINKLSKEAVEKTEFVKGPYLEITLPFEKGKSLKELADEGLISREFSKMGPSVHYEDWKLHIHQERALRHIIQEKRNMVVSTGTGSGKTECYLYPILDCLMREKEAGTLGAGVRALLLFPMNALANDQQKKLRQLLKDYPDITFGRYTGETERKNEKESTKAAEKRLHREHGSETIANERLCREYMAENPPHILLTNYSMLEHLLLRPDTAPFFEDKSAERWQFLVIDEAHTYKGANGIEIAYLLRRLKERIRHYRQEEFRCIATSATLGGEDGKTGLAKFASDLFGEPFEESDVITTSRAKRIRPANGGKFSPEEYIRLQLDSKNMAEEERGKFLKQGLLEDLRLFDVYEALADGPKKIDVVAAKVFADLSSQEEREKALINLIELAAAAKANEFEAALLPARYHLFVKSLEGMFVQYYPKKAVYLDKKEKARDESTGRDNAVFEMANCQKCSQEYLVGKEVSDVNSDKKYFIQTTKAYEEQEFLFFSSADEDISADDFDIDEEGEEAADVSGLKKMRLCLSCGRLTDYERFEKEACCASPKLQVVYRLKNTGKTMESNCCPRCGSIKKGLVKRFLTANQSASYAVGKSLYEVIPAREILLEQEKYNADENDSFWNQFNEDGAVNREIIDESGRKLLIFSDNRQEAAFFAGFLEKRYLQELWRKIVLQCLREQKVLLAGDLLDKVWKLADKMGIYCLDVDADEKKKNNADSYKQNIAAKYIMQEFISPDTGTGLEGLGYIQIEPEPLKIPIPEDVELFGVKGNDSWYLFRYMLDTLRQNGAVNYLNDISAEDDFFAPRNHKGYFRETGSKHGIKKIYGFIPEKGNNKRSGLLKKLWKELAEDKKIEYVNAILEEIYFSPMFNPYSKTKVLENGEGAAKQLIVEKWQFRYVAPEETLYKCNKCGRISGYTVRGVCPNMKCDGKMVAHKAEELRHDPYYENIYGEAADSRFIPMIVREHTAQLSSEAAGDYQKAFEKGEINVLSCSTTFEMGVDVGELEATFLRNVPPETANYIQRAGRAGRRTSSAAFSVTFVRRNSHDLSFFQKPEEIIAGKITPPSLTVDNEKIAARHLNSIIIAWFFSRHREYFDGNAEAIVSEENMRVALRKALDEQPDALLQSIEYVMPAYLEGRTHEEKWERIRALIDENDGVLIRAIQERAEDIKEIEAIKADYYRKDKGIGALTNLVNTLKNEKAIGFLSRKGVLPKYGFPVDTVELDILNDNQNSKIELARDLKLAISEYAPPAKIVANGKVWESYAINRSPGKEWPAYDYRECPHCHTITPIEGIKTINADKELTEEFCEICGTKQQNKRFIIPSFGFSTKFDAKPKRVGENKPRSYYSTRTQYWGLEGRTEKEKRDAKQNEYYSKPDLKTAYSPGGKLFVLNQGKTGNGLLVCPSCGYATDSQPDEKTHRTKYGKPCMTKNMYMRRVSLGHQFSTDIMKIVLPEHKVSINMTNVVESKNQLRSVLYAILEGASQAMHINRGDIDGFVKGKNELMLFDNTPGGSGYVKQVFEKFAEVLEAAREKVSGKCGCSEETACYGCLCNYSNQYFHDELSRGLAQKYLEWLLGETGIGEPTPVEEDFMADRPTSEKKKYSTPLENNNRGKDFNQLLEDCAEISEELREKVEHSSIAEPKHKTPVDIGNGEKVEVRYSWPQSHVFLYDGIDMLKEIEKAINSGWKCFELDEKLDVVALEQAIKRGV